MQIDWITLGNEALRLVANLCAAILLAYVGLRIYFRQKEYELVKNRYLEQCLDVIAADLEHATSTAMHNWSRSLELVKELRDAPENFDQTHLQQGFIPFDRSRFNKTAHQRLTSLSGSNVFWDCYQLALSRHASLNAIAAEQIPHAISEFLAKRLPGATAAEIVETAIEQLRPMPDESDKFAPLLGAIYRISSELERSRLSFAEIETFPRRPAMRGVIADVETTFRTLLDDKPSAY